MVEKIRYIGFYDVNDSEIKRVSSLAATNKMNYIASALNKSGYGVEFVSPSWIDDATYKCKFEKGERGGDERNIVCFVPSFGTNNRFFRALKVFFSLTWLFFWLVFNVKRNEKILAYHSPWLGLPIIMAKKIKGFKLILEVEEVYSDVSSLHTFFNRIEEKIFSIADFYLFATDLLANRMPIFKPAIVIYGGYSTIGELASPPVDGKIHLVYAGIIDSDKAGAFNAVESARFLPEHYLLHIIGFGEIEKLKKRIYELNIVNKCQIIFDGTLNGTEFIKYCQQCHIGLSTQKMEGKYLETSFPSKILTYLGMGLRVVSCEVTCVTKSVINSLVSFYSKEDPESIANAILKVDLKSANNSRQVIAELDSKFVIDLKNMIDYE